VEARIVQQTKRNVTSDGCTDEMQRKEKPAIEDGQGGRDGRRRGERGVRSERGKGKKV